MKKFNLNNINFLKFKKGFTLAETLMTLTIIGIIAVMVIPSISFNYKKQLLLTRAKQGHAILQDALKMYMAKSKSSNLLSLMSPENYKEYYHEGYPDPAAAYTAIAKKFTSVVRDFKICEKEDNRYCATYPVKHNAVDGNIYINKEGETAAGWYNDWQGRFYLMNGISYAFNLYYYAYDPSTGEETTADDNKIIVDGQRVFGYITMDTNGIEEPNQIGADVFIYYVTDKGKLLVGSWAGHINEVLTKNKIMYTPYSFGQKVK